MRILQRQTGQFSLHRLGALWVRWGDDLPMGLRFGLHEAGKLVCPFLPGTANLEWHGVCVPWLWSGLLFVSGLFQRPGDLSSGLRAM